MKSEKNISPQVNLSELDNFLYKGSYESVFHMHASRQGPVVSNEIFLAIKEKEINPQLESIRGLLQPNGSVAKFLHYWLSGLDSQTSTKIISEIKLDGAPLFSDGLFDQKLLNASAEKVFGNWSELTESFMTPLFSVGEGILAQSGFNSKDLETIKDFKGNSQVSFEEAMVKIPSAVINIILARHNLPLYETILFNPEKVSGLDFKFTQDNKILDEYNLLIKKKTRQYESAYATIAKILKSYSKFPNEKQMEWVIGRSHRIDPSFKGLYINNWEIRYRFDNPGLKHKSIPNYLDQINASLLAHKRSIANFKTDDNSVIYIDGENMIKAMFSIANQKGYTLALQEFMRGTNYDLYRSLLNLYPGLRAVKSSFKIWDTEQFPEFDQNFIKALKYLYAKESK